MNVDERVTLTEAIPESAAYSTGAHCILAVLVDRNRRLTNSPQVYGMQFFIDADKAIRFFDMVNTSQIDARRMEIGLIPFYCWALEVSKKNKGASIHWPAGVLFSPQRCPDAR